MLYSSSSKMEIPSSSILCSLFVIILVLLLPNTSVAKPRSQTVKITCGTQLELNTMTFVPNFIGVMETISQQMRTRGYRVAVMGTGPDSNYGLAQCYGFRSKGQACMQKQDHKEYIVPTEARRAVQQAVANALSNNGSARAQVSVPGSSNDTAYILADCWKTLSANSCTTCLQNTPASMLGCLPWSEGRALYIGCFMRYSDMNFLNVILTSGGSSSREKVIVIVIVVSSIIALGVGASIGIGVWKNKQIQKKRKGKYFCAKIS
ncbi:hypothetical protein P3S67_014093 [Capsicum chacoense]